MKSTHLILITAFLIFGLNLSSAYSRSPSVNPLMEIDIESSEKPKDAKEGFDFSASEKTTARVPANITTNHQNSGPMSYLGPILFLLALPIGIWLMVSKKFAKKEVEHHPFSNLKELKTDRDDHNDDLNFPKAS